MVKKLGFMKKLLILFIFVIILSVFIPNEISALNVIESATNPDTSGYSGSYALKYLVENWYVLCCRNGDKLWDYYNSYTYSSTTYGSTSSTAIAPSVAYLLATMERTNYRDWSNGTYHDYPTKYHDDGQIAWWLSSDRSHDGYKYSSTISSTSGRLYYGKNLLSDATKFQDYINSILGVSSVSSITYKEYTISGYSFYAPDLSNITLDLDSSNVEVPDEESEDDMYVIGPFNLDYYSNTTYSTYDSKYKYYAYLSGVTLIFDGETMSYGTNSDYYLTTSSSGSTSGAYSSVSSITSGTNFYLVINTDEDLTDGKNINLSFTYTYTNAGGKFKHYNLKNAGDTGQYLDIVVCGFVWTDTKTASWSGTLKTEPKTVSLSGYVWSEKTVNGESGLSALGGQDTEEGINNISVTATKVLIAYDSSDCVMYSFSSTTTQTKTNNSTDGYWTLSDLSLALSSSESSQSVTWNGTKKTVSAWLNDESGKYRIAYIVAFSYDTDDYSMTEYLAEFDNSASTYISKYNSTTIYDNSMAMDYGTTSSSNVFSRNCGNCEFYGRIGISIIWRYII